MIMKKIGKYMVAGLMLIGFSACSNDSDGLLSSESTEVSRSSDLVTQTIALTTAGTLQSSLEAVMSDPTTLQKLVLSGPFNGTDVQYWKTTLTNLVEFDASVAVPTYTEGQSTYKDPYGNDMFINDNYIEGHIFSFMTKLEHVKFPTGATSIGYEPCHGCTSLVSVELMSNIAEIPSHAFYNCTNLTTIKLASSIEMISNYAFYNCTSLKDYSQFAQIETLYDGAFQHSGLESVDLTNVISCTSQVFYECESLTSIVLPPTMKSLPSSFLTGCTSLSNITCPTALETIGNSAFSRCGFTEFTIPSSVTTIGYGAFQNTKLKTLTVPATVTEVGGSLIDGCSNLSALVWNSAAPVEDTWGVSSDCYLFIPNADVVVGPNWKNIVVDGVAEIVELCPEGYRTESGVTYSVPIPFKAKKITFSREFNRQTVPGESSGWYTIVLPFTPTKIEHETKGIAAPFNSGVEGAKPFWLRELTAEGFVDKTTIEPNKAYIIAMPNHGDYVDEYCLNGKITFSAENVELAATPETLAPSVGPEYSLQPTYNYVEHGVDIYALNVDYWVDGYHNGSIFVRNTSSVYAFEAYATLAGRSARSVFDMNTASKASRSPYKANKTGIPQIGDM